MIYLLLVPASSDEKLYFDEIFDQFSVDCHNENDKKNDAGVGGIVFKFWRAHEWADVGLQYNTM